MIVLILVQKSQIDIAQKKSNNPVESEVGRNSPQAHWDVFFFFYIGCSENVLTVLSFLLTSQQWKALVPLHKAIQPPG